MPGLGVQKITEYAHQFCFGTKTGIDLPGEADGFLPSKEWKEKTKGEPWFVGDTYHLSIGQGDLLVTPIQMAVGTAMLANGGTRVQPTLLEKVNGKEVAPIFLESKKLIGKDWITIVRQGMRKAVTEGSARALNALSKPVAGKTGTAQVRRLQKQPDAAWHPFRDHAWFAGYAPAEDPRIAIVVLVEHGGKGGHVAAPIAAEIVEAIFDAEDGPVIP